MSTHQKTYRFRLQPTSGQEAMLMRFASARRWAWNWALRRKEQSCYQETGQNLSLVGEHIIRQGLRLLAVGHTER